MTITTTKRLRFPPLLLLLATLPAACARTTRPAAAPTATAAASQPAPAPSGPQPPVAKREPHPQSVHGVTLVDDYYWLRAKGSAPVENYLKAENDYTAAMTQATQPLEHRLYEEMRGRVKETDVSVPYRHDGWFYYSRFVEGQQYPLVCRKSAQGAKADDRTGATATAPEQVMLDLNEIAKSHKFVAINASEVSDDGQLYAYSLDVTGFRQYTLHFADLTGRRSFAEEIPRVREVEWMSDNRTVYYVVEDETTKRANRLYRHVVGSDPAKDPIVYEEKDERFDLYLDRTRSRQWLVLTAESKVTTEVRVLRADRANADWRVVEPRQQDVRYYVEHNGSSFYIRTDAPATAGGAKARNFRLVTAPVATPDRGHWRELIPHRDDVMLSDVEMFSDHMVLGERVDGLPRLRVRGLGAHQEARTIAMPEAIYNAFSMANAEYATPVLRFLFVSLVTPESVYEYDIAKQALTLLKRQEVPNYDPSRYSSTRLYATAKDGTKVPISLVYRKDLTPATPHPTYLTGYGSYGYPYPIAFSSTRASLLDRGVVVAVAHIRGGGEMGQRWHDEGRMGTKMNTFTDFIACAEELIRDGWAARDRIGIEGGSAGGLLMGAVTNLRPDLWKAVIAHVPFVDVMNTMLDETLPLTVSEFEEWGNPKKPDEFATMIKYSPYDNVAKKDYPSLLVMTSYNDSQVMYWEPAKWVARLRANKTDRNPLLLRINMEPAGHGGQSGRFNRLRETAFADAFLLTQLGIDK